MEKKPPLYSRSGKVGAAASASMSTPIISASASMSTPIISNGNKKAENGKNDSKQLSGAVAALEGVGAGGALSPSPIEAGGMLSTSSLGMAQRFSVLTLKHVEEVRQELLLTSNSNNIFEGKNAAEITVAFQELQSAYDKLSMLKWDAVRKEYEEKLCGRLININRREFDGDGHAGQAAVGFAAAGAGLSGNGAGRMGAIATDTNSNMSNNMGADLKMKEGSMDIKALGNNPWRIHNSGEDDNIMTPATTPISEDGAMNPHDWIAAAFFSPAENGNTDNTASALESSKFAAAVTSPTNNTNSNTAAAPPPGFALAHDVASAAVEEKDEDTQQQRKPHPHQQSQISDLTNNSAKRQISDLTNTSANNSAHHVIFKFDDREDRETTQSTSVPSEISSLHTSSHYHTQDGYESSSSNSNDGSNKSTSNEESEQVEESDDHESLTISSSSSKVNTSSLHQLDRQPSKHTLDSHLDPSNFDYIYRGGYALRVTSGKETPGTVPRTVKHVLVDSSITTIENEAFQGCLKLESIVIPYSVERVGDSAFRKCSALRRVVFLTKNDTSNKQKKENSRKVSKRGSYGNKRPYSNQSNLRSIGNWAFFNCSSLTSIRLPYGLESIGTRAFQRCSSLSLVAAGGGGSGSALPKSLKSIGENAFHGCPRETKAALEVWERDQQGL